MIFELIFAVFNTVVTGLFGIFPSLPEVPEVVETSGEWLLTVTRRAMGFVSWILTPQLLVAGIGALIAIWQFERIYHIVLYVIKRIRG